MITPSPINLKRSNAPIFWLLFGAGGMLSALIGPVLVFITGFAAPLGWIIPADALSYSHMAAFTHSLLGKAFLLAIISLFLWHAAHRLLHSLHDLGIHLSAGTRLVGYGLAFVGTLATLCLLLT